MTKDMILVERWTNGTKCVGLDNMGGCSHFSWPAPDDAKCNVFGEPLSTGDGILRRCPTCLATPSAVVLTPEIKARLEALEAVAKAAHGYCRSNDTRPFELTRALLKAGYDVREVGFKVSRKGANP